MKKRVPGRVPLERALSKLGMASRTQARSWILNGKVRVNGTLRLDPDFYVRPETAKIEIDGEVRERPAFLFLVLHKPKGVVTTRSDEKGRPTVFSLIPPAAFPDSGHLVAVGRLDFATTGLLLLTNHSRLAAWLTDPNTQIPRTYVVTVRGKLGSDATEKLRGGILDQGDILRADDVEIRKTSGRESTVIVTLLEGKNREIRRMFLALGNEVTRLKRIRYGNIELGELPPGHFRTLSQEEIQRAFPGAPAFSSRAGSG